MNKRVDFRWLLPVMTIEVGWGLKRCINEYMFTFMLCSSNRQPQNLVVFNSK